MYLLKTYAHLQELLKSRICLRSRFKLQPVTFSTFQFDNDGMISKSSFNIKLHLTISCKWALGPLQDIVRCSFKLKLDLDVIPSLSN
jgi:hypothetical protein